MAKAEPAENTNEQSATSKGKSKKASAKVAKKKPAAKKGEAGSAAEKATLVPPLISFAILVLLVALITFGLIPKRQSTDLQRHTSLLASQQASVVHQSISQLRNRMTQIAAAEVIRKTVSGQETDALKNMSEQLSRGFPEAVNALLIPLDSKGITGLRKHGIKLRNNIESSLVNRAEDGKNTYPEAYQYNGDKQFTLVVPVYEADEMEVNGAILLRMPMSFIQPALGTVAADRGTTELIQKFGKQEQLLLTAGKPGDRSAEPLSMQIDESSWWVRFTPSSAVASELSIPLWHLLLLLAIPAIAIPVWHFLSLRKLQASQDGELDALSGYAQSLISGNKRMPPVFENNKLNQLAQLVASFRRPAPAPAAAAAETSAPASKTKPTAKAPASAAEAEQKATTDTLPQVDVPANIFRAYDIRGEADKYLTDEVVHAIGLAIGSEARERGQEEIAVACDGRLSSPRIKQALCRGLMDAGQDILDVGQVPTPVLYFATHQLETQAGVMITGSHNDAECNGLKLVLDGKPLSGEHIQNIRKRIGQANYTQGSGSVQEANVVDAYVEAITGDIAVAQTLRIVVDAGNGIGGVIGPRVLEELGCEVISLHCDVDGNFPNHSPDPTIAANLSDLIMSVVQHEADFGIAFDGDADRVCVVDSKGNAVAPDILLMLFAQDIVSRNPGADIIYDVKCTRHLSSVISSYGGRPIMWKSGHSCIKEKMLQTGALLGGEFTGHICFKERWFGFDDGIYSAARLVEIVSTSGLSLEELIEEYPESRSTPEIIVDTGEQQKFDIVEALTDNAQFGAGKITTLDGIRVDYPDGWGLIRPSNTVPAITLRFEADNDEALERIQSVFREQIGLVNPTVASAF